MFCRDVARYVSTNRPYFHPSQMQVSVMSPAFSLPNPNPYPYFMYICNFV